MNHHPSHRGPDYWEARIGWISGVLGPRAGTIELLFLQCTGTATRLQQAAGHAHVCRQNENSISNQQGFRFCLLMNWQYVEGTSLVPYFTLDSVARDCLLHHLLSLLSHSPPSAKKSKGTIASAAAPTYFFSVEYRPKVLFPHTVKDDVTVITTYRILGPV